MSEDRIERALREERPIAPSSDFADRVLQAVQLEADRREAIAFPWRRLAPGLAISAVLAVLAVWGAPPPSEIEPVFGPLSSSAAWISATLAGTYALVRATMRVASPGI